LHRRLPQAFALTRTLAQPLRAGISHCVGGDSLHRRVAWVAKKTRASPGLRHLEKI
jgi:hypothetical protein